MTPVDVIEQRERIAYLHDAVEHLPERLRTVVEGYFFQDRPMAELAGRARGVREPDLAAARRGRALLRGALTAALEPDLADKHERPEGCAARRKESYYASVASHRSYAARLSVPVGHPDVHTA